MNCPYCKFIIDKNNIDEDTVYCPNCHEVFNISELKEKNKFDIKNPPKGAWFRQKKGEKIIGATLHNYIGYILLAMNLYLSYSMYQEISIEDSRFYIDRLVIVISMIFLFFLIAFFLLGKTEIILENNKLTIFEGIRNIGRRKKINIKDINKIRLEERTGRRDRKYKVIVIETDKENTFGASLSEKRIYFMYFALRKNIIPTL